jgi:hypothetical protein
VDEMAGSVYFEDNTLKVINTTDTAIEATLLECSAELVSATARNTRVGTGQLKNSWRAEVQKTSTGYESVIGSEEENAIWEEFGTGEHALNNDGRKGYWIFVKGSSGSKKSGKSYTLKEAKRIMAILRKKGLDAYYTKGKKPSRAFWNAYTSNKDKIINHFQSKFKGYFT